MATVPCFSSPALHRISAMAKIRHSLLVLLEGLNLLRTKWHLSAKKAVWGDNTVNAPLQGSIHSSGYKALLDVN